MRAEAEWFASYGEGLAAARARKVPLLVYFPPTGDASDPIAIARGAGGPLDLPIVRIGPQEVSDRLATFRLERLPALVLVDRRENVIVRWEGSIGAAVWSEVGAAERQLERRHAAELKTARRAVDLLADGRVESALARARPLLEDPLASLEAYELARGIHREVLDREAREVLRVLAAERLIPAADLVRSLRLLRKRVLLEETRARIDGEVAVLVAE